MRILCPLALGKCAVRRVSNESACGHGTLRRGSPCLLGSEITVGTWDQDSRPLQIPQLHVL